MADPAHTIPVYLEIGQKRMFAGALDWPGWCRSGRNEAAALDALLAAAPRYARALASAGLDFHPPTAASALAVVERLAGNATTDFGAPGLAPAADAAPIDAAELERLQAILVACWQAFDAAAAAAAGRELRRGPRGGGRDVDAIVQHVLAAEAGYLRRLAWQAARPGEGDPTAERDAIRQAVLAALAAAARGEVPERGPRGGRLWPARYFVRRVAWHVLDHAWEIEDRLT